MTENKLKIISFLIVSLLMLPALANAMPKDCVKDVSPIFQGTQPQEMPKIEVYKNICIDARLFKNAAIGDAVQWDIDPIEMNKDGKANTLMITQRKDATATSLTLFEKDGKTYTALLVSRKQPQNDLKAVVVKKIEIGSIPNCHDMPEAIQKANILTAVSDTEKKPVIDVKITAPGLAIVQYGTTKLQKRVAVTFLHDCLNYTPDEIMKNPTGFRVVGYSPMNNTDN